MRASSLPYLRDAFHKMSLRSDGAVTPVAENPNVTPLAMFNKPLGDGFVFLDFETYYDDEYTLKKLVTPAYILDPRFEVLGVSVAVGDGDPVYVTAPNVEKVLRALGMDKKVFVSFNTAFDGAILAWRYGIRPLMYVDALGMARALIRPCSPNLSLKNAVQVKMIPADDGSGRLLSVSDILGHKDEDVILNMKGVTYKDLERDPAKHRRLATYANQDNSLCRGQFKALMPYFPYQEYWVMDSVLRMALEPQAGIDAQSLGMYKSDLAVADSAMLLKLARELLRTQDYADTSKQSTVPSHREAARKAYSAYIAYEGRPGAGHGSPQQEAFERAMRSLLRKDSFIADTLIRMGIEPPTKVSPTTGNIIYAFAKTDHAFADLMEPDAEAADDAAESGESLGGETLLTTLVRGRLAVKSTIEATRTQRMLDVAALNWDSSHIKRDSSWSVGNQRLAPLPFPLRYAGAHTHRFSGTDRINMQNLGRTSKLRAAIRARKGFKVVAVDASQIEARIVAWLSDCVSLLNQFSSGGDPYCAMASTVYSRTITKEDVTERKLGKFCVLGLGYGMGVPRFISTCRNAGMSITDGLAQRAVDAYRKEFAFQVPVLWTRLSSIIEVLLLRGKSTPRAAPHNAAIYTYVPETNDIVMVSVGGLTITYGDVQTQKDDFGRNEHTALVNGSRRKLFGGLLLEHLTQHLARVIVMDTAKRVFDSGVSYRPLGQAHDELIYHVPEDEAELVGLAVAREMSVSPTWAPTLPLAAEYAIGDTYLECK